MTPPLLVVVGPTASGKTRLAVELCELLHGEVLSADSIQVYRHFNAGSGKPSQEELSRARHHWIDVLEPQEPLDAAGWAVDANATLAEIRARGKTPIVCGGSYLWVKALLFGLVPAPPANPELRQEHRALVEQQGRAALHAELARRDPITAARLAPNDFVRVSRALEVQTLTGVAMSQWQAQHGFRDVLHPHRLLGVARTKPELDARIAIRVGEMLASGWLEEVRQLCDAGYGEARAMSSVGYRQVRAAAVQSEPIDFAELHASVVRTTRIFARRQRTWLRDANVTWVNPELPVASLLSDGSLGDY